jgi:surface antigen
MRLHSCVALFVTAVAACTLGGPLALPAAVQAAENIPTATRPCACPERTASEREARPKYAVLQNNLDEDDEIAALEAIRIALSEVGDGSKFVWRRANGRISGVITPTSSFKDAGGRVCRHIVILLAAGRRTGKIEGVACRLGDGRWALEG